MRRKLSSFLRAILFLLALPAGYSFALKANPDVIEAGDSGIFTVPYANSEGGIEPIINARLEISPPPVWITIDTTTSFLGPVDIYPGEEMMFTVNYEINDQFNPDDSSGAIVLSLLSDSTSFVPSAFSWRFTTDNGYKTMRGDCLDNNNIFCGKYLSPDIVPPNTELEYDGPQYLDGNGNLFISTYTATYIYGGDRFESNAVISGVTMTGYAVDSIPPDFDALDFSTNTVLLPEGSRILYFAGRDFAGNTEVIKSSTVIVDGTAPGAPIGLKADDAEPSPWKNVLEFSLSWTNPTEVSGVTGARVKYGDPAPVTNEEGVFYPADNSLVYSSMEIINGENTVWLWLEDNVGNADPLTASSVTLRYDDELPVSAASAPAASSAAIVQVGFVAADAFSGVKETVLWYRNNAPDWSSGTYVLSGSTGTFSFDASGHDGSWEFYPQAFDNAGNGEPVPVSTTPAKAAVYVDATPPVISNVRVTEITYDSARISWETSEDASGRVEYGLSGAYENSVNTPDGGTSHSLYLTGLLYPANYAFKITATNSAGGSVVYTGGAFYVPPKLTTTDDWGVIGAGQPIVIEVSNPYVSTISYTLNGQTVTQEVSAGTPLEIYPGQGQTSLSLNVDGFTYSTSFVVDTATRTVRLARLVIDAGGIMSQPAGGTGMDATFGQAAQQEMSNGSSRIYLGYYAGIDPVAPGSITNLSPNSGPGEGQATLSWSAPGDDAYAGTAVKYDIRWSTTPINDAAAFLKAAKAADIPFPQAAGTAQTAVISGLNLLATYYFSIRTADELGNLSELSNPASLFKGYVLSSTVTVNGVSEISFVSPVAPSVTLISTVSATGAVAIGSAADSGLTLAGNMYEIGPEGTFDPLAVLTFHYSTSSLAELGLLEADIAVYEHFTGQGWVKLPGQVVDTAGHKITVPITQISSLFGIFGPVKDRVPPVTGISYAGISYKADVKVYLNAGSSVTLTANDPVVYATSTGVAFTEYRVDPGTASVFVPYTAPFTLAEGFHKIEFRSADKAGNLEETRYDEVYVDAAAPLTDVLIAGTTGQAGWYISMATVTLVSTDSLSGVSTTYYRMGASTETLKYTGPLVISSEGVSGLYYFSADNVGNTEAEKSGLLKMDFSAPQVYAVSSPTANTDGWNNAAVSVVFSGTDAVSGVAYCSSTAAVSMEGSTLTVSGYCMDHAGWSSTKTVSVSIDTTAPSMGYTQVPEANEFGWNASSVTLKFACEDGLSGIKSCPADIRLTAEGVNISTSARALDVAGNIKELSVSGINIDKTLPVSSAALAGTFRNGWYSSPVAVTLTSTDPLSGIKQTLYSLDGAPFVVYQQALNVSADGAHTARYYAADKAGNIEAEKAVSFSIDRTAPQTGHTIIPLPNENGWNKSGVNVVFNGTDTLSGVESCYSQGVSQEGANQQIAGWCRDKAGNMGYSTATVSIDLTMPVVRATRSPMPNADGWNNTSVMVGFGGEDALSGIAYCTADKNLTTEGAAQLVSGSCGDKAGNTASAGVTLNIDLTAPVISYSTFPVPNTAGWNNSDVAIKFTCADGLSGIKSCPADITISAEGMNISTSAKTFDLAGNAAQAAISGIKIDKTKPVIVISSPVAGNVFVATKDMIRPFFSVKDNFDPAPAFSAYLEQVEDRGSPRGTRSAKIAVTSGQSVEPLDIDDGIWRLTVSATDFADNAVMVFGGTFEVIHDVLAPNTDLHITGTRYDGDGIIYLKRDTAFTLTSVDDLIQAGDGIGLGVKSQSIKVWSEGSPAQAKLFENTHPKQGDQFVSTTTFSSLWTLPDGRYNFDFKAEDILGNVEPTRHSFFGLDDTAPEASAQLAGTMGENGWHISTVTVTLSASDELSGVAGIFYRLDGAEGDDFVQYTGAFSVSVEGEHTVLFYARDNLGNTSTAVSRSFKIDRTAPAVAKAIAPAANQDGWHNGLVKVTFSGTDAVSGIAYCDQPKTMLAEGRDLTLSGYCRDYAGLSSTVTASFNVDLTGPTVSIARSPLANAYGWNNADVTATFACTDLLSGIKACPPEKIFNSEGANRGISGIAVDYADNMTGAAISGINIDKTAPESLLLLSGDVWQDGGSKFLSLRSVITLSALDPVSGGTASGVEAIERRIDAAQFSVYASSFGLSEGIRTVTYRALDKAGNIETGRSAEFHVDGTPPLTALTVTSGMQYAGAQAGSFYVSLASRFGLPAVDPVVADVASGVRETSWNDNGGTVAHTTEGLAFSEGRHILTYQSIDNVDNLEVNRSTTILVDNTAPVTTHHIGSPYYSAGGVNYITPETPITFTAADPTVSDVASGVDRIEVSIDGGAFSDYNAALTFMEGRHTIRFRAIDNVGNTEAEQTLNVQSDNTAPVSNWLVSEGESIELGGRFYLNGLGKIALESTDPVVANVTSGVEGIYFGIDTAPAGKYTTPFGLSEGIRIIKFTAKDNVLNTEVMKSTVIYVDGSKPISVLSVSGDQYHGDKTYVSARSEIVITTEDPVVSEVASGVRETKYSVDGGAFADFTRFKLSAEGKRLVSFFSADKVNNVEVVKTSELWVDVTTPVTELSISGARHDADALIYITKDSGIVLTPSDPVSADTASGVLLTKYRVDGGDWQVYSGSFTITTEGRHTLEYRSLDRVQNTEEIRTASLAVDNTPPATSVSLGEPKFEVFGLPVLRPETPITLAAADIVSSGVAAGLKTIFYEPVDLAGGSSGVRTYTEPFTLPEGSYDLRYWSADNLGNVELYKQVRFAVGTFQDDSLQAVDMLDMSGTADISGAVRSNGLVELSGNPRILGDVTASTITLAGKAQITGIRTIGVMPISPEPIYLGAIPEVPISTFPAGFIEDGRLKVSSQSELVLTTGTYHFNGIDLSGDCNVRVAGKVDILVSGAVLISGGSTLNIDGVASNLNIFVNTVSSVTFVGGGDMVAKVYAPLSHMKLSGNAVLGGHFFVKTAAVSGTGNIIQAGETLPQVAASTGDSSGGKKKASAFAASAETFSVLAGPDAAFRLGEVYVFPNPALRGAAPTLHIEVGLADRVKITFYTVSGRQAHQTTLTGMPVSLDDGNGLSYAYEYAWRESIPSGVYYYSIVAEKGGEKIRKAGKFAVVR